MDTRPLDDILGNRKENADEVARKTARKIRIDAIAAAPSRTGNLKKSIHTFRVVNGHWTVVVNRPYGRYVEFGTSQQAAQPFLVPAVAKHRQSFTEDVIREVLFGGRTR